MLFVSFGIAASIYRARRKRFLESVLDIVAGVCVGFVLNYMGELQSGPSGDRMVCGFRRAGIGAAAVRYVESNTVVTS